MNELISNRNDNSEEHTLELFFADLLVNNHIRRMVYPSIEISRKGANVPPNITDVTQKLWWDQ